MESSPLRMTQFRGIEMQSCQPALPELFPVSVRVAWPKSLAVSRPPFLPRKTILPRILTPCFPAQAYRTSRIKPCQTPDASCVRRRNLSFLRVENPWTAQHPACRAFRTSSAAPPSPAPAPMEKVGEARHARQNLHSPAPYRLKLHPSRRAAKFSRSPTSSAAQLAGLPARRL